MKSFGELTASENGDFGGAKIHIIQKGNQCQYSLEWAEGFPVSYLSKKQTCPKADKMPTQIEVFEVQGQWAMDKRKGEKLSIAQKKGTLELKMQGVPMTAKPKKTLSPRDQSDLAGRIIEANHFRSCVRAYNRKFPKDPYLAYIVANSQNAINEKAKLPVCKANALKDFKSVKGTFRSYVIKEYFLGSYNSEVGMQCIVDGFLNLPKKDQKQFIQFASNFFLKMDYYYSTGVGNYLYTLKKTNQVKNCMGKMSNKECHFIKDLLSAPQSFIKAAKKEAKKRKDNDSLKSIIEVEKDLKNFI